MDKENIQFNFNLNEADIFPAIRWERYPLFRYAQILKRALFYLSIILILILIFGIFSESLSANILAKVLGLLLIFLSLAIFFWQTESFFNLKLKTPHLREQGPTIGEAIAKPGQYNLADFLSFEVAKAVFRAIRFAKTRKLSAIDSTPLFYFLLRDTPKLNFIFARANLNILAIFGELKANLSSLGGAVVEQNFSQDFQKVILEALKIASKGGHLRATAGDVLGVLAQHNLIFKKILVETKLKFQDIENLTWWLESLEDRIERAKKFWSHENLIRKGSLAKDWAAGYTITLDQYSIDWTEIIKIQGLEEIIGHKNAISAVERILSGTGINNVLLVGEPGAGRKSIVRAIAQRALNGQSLPDLNYKRVVELDLTSLLSKVPSLEEVEFILDRIFKEVITAGNIILVIDEFQNYIGQIQKPGVIDISGALSPYLSLPIFQIVAICTFAGLHKNIEQNSSLLSLFEKVEIGEVSEQETILILESMVPFFEKKYKKFITYPALRDIVSHSSRYLPATPFPKKAVDLLDEVMVYVSQNIKTRLVLPEHIAKIVSEKTQIPVGEIEAKEKEILLNLEKLIHQRIINQEEAVSEVSMALKRARADITIRKGPMGGFLFLGPTGVGKTETSKALAAIYFGAESRMIRLDMSEFQTLNDIPRLLGSTGEEGLLTTPVRETPFSLLLLDEIEKSHPNILNLFLQVLDEGFITDGLGRRVLFNNTIIIATSNAGYQIILEALKNKTEWSGIKEKLLDFLFNQGIFRPEFINRFDAVVVFKPLTRENLLDVAELLLSKLKENLAQKEIEFIITPQLKEKIVELGYNPIFGAREMRRVIQDKVEDVLAEALLKNEIKRGMKIEIDPHTISRTDRFTLRILPSSNS